MSDTAPGRVGQTLRLRCTKSAPAATKVAPTIANGTVAEPVMGGEDFSQYGRAGVPSLMYFLGVVEPRRLEYFQTQVITPPSLHSAEFYPHVEPSLTTGIISMASGVLDLLKK